MRVRKFSLKHFCLALAVLILMRSTAIGQEASSYAFTVGHQEDAYAVTTTKTVATALACRVYYDGVIMRKITQHGVRSFRLAPSDQRKVIIFRGYSQFNALVVCEAVSK